MSVESDKDIKYLKGNFFSNLLFGLRTDLRKPVKKVTDYPQFADSQSASSQEAPMMDGSRSAANKADTIRLKNFILGHDEDNL